MIKNNIKKLIKRVIRIVLFIYLSFFLFLLIFVVYEILTTNTRTVYKDNWGINILNPKNINSIYKNEGFQFGMYLDILHYEKDEIKKIIQENNFKNIKDEDKEYLKKKYNDFITTNYFMRDDEELQNIYNSTIQPNNRFNENNYYILLEKGYLNSTKYNLLILIIDIESNNVYSIQFFR